MNQPKTILVQGRRWFDRTYGNTYHSVLVEVDGEVVGIEPFAYGYDEQYIQTAENMLVDKGILPKFTYDNGFNYGLRRVCDELGIELTTTVTDGRKKDLHQAENLG